MKTHILAAASIAALVVAWPLVGSAAAQDMFTTEDFHQDRALWSDPAYYRNNTVSELRNMQVRNRYGEAGSGEETPDLRSSYGYATAAEHYQALLEAAHGGTEHDLATLPDWDGRWETESGWLGGALVPSTMVAVLTPQHQEYFVQAQKAAAEGRDWWPTAFCLPGDYFSIFNRGPNEFIVRPHQVVVLSEDNVDHRIRWVHANGSGHIREEFRFPRWLGESIGFWDGDALVVYTNQIRGWKSPVFEYSDALETVERYQRVGNVIEGEVTIYDPTVFVAPLHAKVSFNLREEAIPENRPLFNSCTDTNGPSVKVHLDENGILNERTPEDPLYWDPLDPRPWGTYFDESDERYKIYLQSTQR